MSGEEEPKRTTKYVRGTFSLTFHGDYLSTEELEAHFQHWIDTGLDDREDLWAWKFTAYEVQEVSGDPEGFDD